MFEGVQMDFKKLLVSTLIVGFVMWSISGIWHNLILASFYVNEAHATHEGVGILLVAYLILGMFMVYLYDKLYKGGNGVIEGMKFGVLIGLLWVFPHELAMAGAHGEALGYVFKNGAWHMIEQGLGGIVIGLLHHKLR